MSKQSKKLKKKLRRKARKQYYLETAQDYHHICFQARFWQVGFAKLLRDHPYLGKYIPKYTLHHEIHDKIHDIPVPNETECRYAYNELLRREDEGTIDVKFDTLEQRISFLIEMWEGKCPATVEILKWQRDVVAKYYERRSEMQGQLEFFAEVNLPDEVERRGFVESLKKYGITGEEHGPKVIVRYTGGANTVSKLYSVCEPFPFRSINVRSIKD